MVPGTGVEPALECGWSAGENGTLQVPEIPTKDGGGGGNRTRVRMASSQRVYVCSSRPISAVPVTRTREATAQADMILVPGTVCQRPGTSLLMTPATR